jgi:hypothetical protein
MNNIKTFEKFSDFYKTKLKDIPKYFSKDNREKRTKKDFIENQLIQLINNKILIIKEGLWLSNFPIPHGDSKVGNLKLKTKQGTFHVQLKNDYTIDVYGSVTITKSGDFTGIKFNQIAKDFKMMNCNKYDFLPEKVWGNMILDDCDISSLKEIPTKEVKGNFDVSNNYINDFEGIPIISGEDVEFNFQYNNIYTMDYFPSHIKDIIYHGNPIEHIRISKGKLDTYDTLISYLVQNPTMLELFLEYDPIRPPDSNKRPTIYLDRMNDFLATFGFNDLEVTRALRNKYNIE